MEPIRNAKTHATAAAAPAAPKAEPYRADLSTGRFHTQSRPTYFAMKSLNLHPEAAAGPRIADYYERSRPGEDFKPTSRGIVFARPLGPNQTAKDRVFERVQFVNAQGKAEVHKVIDSELGQNQVGERGAGYGIWTEDKAGRTSFFEVRNLLPFGAEPKPAPQPAAPRRRLTAPVRSEQGSDLKEPIASRPDAPPKAGPAPARAKSLRGESSSPKPQTGAVVAGWAASPGPSAYATFGGERAPRKPIEKRDPKEVAWADAGPAAAPARPTREYVPNGPPPDPVDPRRYHGERMTPAAEQKWGAFYGLLQQGWHPAQAARHPDVGDANYRAVRGQKDHFEIRLDGSNRAIFQVEPGTGKVGAIQVGGHLD